MFDEDDEAYWEAEILEEDSVRAKCHERNIDEAKIDRLLNDHFDAFDISDDDLDDLENEDF